MVLHAVDEDTSPQRRLESSTTETRSPLAIEGAWLRRLVVKDSLNLLHNLWRQLVQQLQCLHVVVDLVSLGGAEDDGAHVRVLHTPGDGELAYVAPDSLGDLRELRMC